MDDLKPIPIFIHLVILGYGKFASTTQLCLESVIAQRTRDDVRVTVLDNGSPDDAATLQEAYLQSYPEIQSLILPQNLGYAGGMNYGVGVQDSEWVLLLGSDTILSPTAFEILYNYLKAIDSKVGIVGPVTNEAGTSQKLDFDAQLPRDIFLEFQQKYPQPTMLHIPLYRADFFCVAIRKILWDQLSGLDLSYGRGYYEDFDFCMRAKVLGYEAVMLEDMFVYHAGSASFKSDSTQKQLIQNNKKTFIKKFPKALLLHRRADNMKAIEYYLTLPNTLFHSPAIQVRLQQRLSMALRDEPRSFWKKWLWRKKVNQIKTQIENI